MIGDDNMTIKCEVKNGESILFTKYENNKFTFTPSKENKGSYKINIKLSYIEDPLYSSNYILNVNVLTENTTSY
jgi:hypothetical protein